MEVVGGAGGAGGGRASSRAWRSGSPAASPLPPRRTRRG